MEEYFDHLFHPRGFSISDSGRFIAIGRYKTEKKLTTVDDKIIISAGREILITNEAFESFDVLASDRGVRNLEIDGNTIKYQVGLEVDKIFKTIPLP